MMFEQKTSVCITCGRIITYMSATTEHPESPEFVKYSGWTAVYLTATNDARVIHCCTNECLQQFFKKGG